MKHCIAVCCTLVFGTAGTAYAKLPPPSEGQIAKAAADKGKLTEQAKKDAQALARAQDRAVENYKRNKLGTSAALPTTADARKKPVQKRASATVEKLACRTGTEDRHARIGVEVVNNRVSYFAYYSKWKPRTCSIEMRRGGAYSRWEDQGDTSRVVLIEDKGVFVIDGKGGRYRFVFRDVDRMRFCGMDGKINGSLTVMRGKSSCEVQGVMEGHAG